VITLLYRPETNTGIYCCSKFYEEVVKWYWIIVGFSHAHNLSYNGFWEAVKQNQNLDKSFLKSKRLMDFYFGLQYCLNKLELIFFNLTLSKLIKQCETTSLSNGSRHPKNNCFALWFRVFSHLFFLSELVSTRMCVEHCGNGTEKWESQHYKKNLSDCHFVNRKFHMGQL
jgi:hypothetical protein